LLELLVQRVPLTYSKYIEPFIGGGALFFRLLPPRAVISDSNPELVNCYRMVQGHVEEVIDVLQRHPYSEDFYYVLRSIQPSQLTDTERAARLIYLNKTCYNGLYRVNKQGVFNVPFGHRKNPIVCDSSALRAASQALRDTIIEEGDYRDILQRYGKYGDFVYLDPPYYPVSAYADFKRYTKEFFYESDHADLAMEFRRLVDSGVKVVLSNSNTEFTRRLFQGFDYQIVDTRRNISCNGSGRDAGEDLIVFATSPMKRSMRRRATNGASASIFEKSETLAVLERFPGTKYMGSKYNVLDFIWESIKGIEFASVLDAFSGSACVSYLFKSHGKRVFSNDLMHFCFHTANALIANNGMTITDDEMAMLLAGNPSSPTFIQDTFKGLYFSDDDNLFLDQVRANVDQLQDFHKRSIALSSLVRACLKRRARGIFTYVGERYYDDRRDLQMSIREHFIAAVAQHNRAVFDNGQTNIAFNGDVFELDVGADLVYIDPPYYSPHSDNDYVRRYHFVEGLVRYWNGVEIDAHTATKKFRKYPTLFDGRDSTYEAFRMLFEKFRDSILVVSYSSNCLPTKSELATMIKEHKRRVSVFQIGHTYSFGTQRDSEQNANKVEEFIFVGY